MEQPELALGVAILAVDSRIEFAALAAHASRRERVVEAEPARERDDIVSEGGGGRPRDRPRSARDYGDGVDGALMGV